MLIRIPAHSLERHESEEALGLERETSGTLDGPNFPTSREGVQGTAGARGRTSATRGPTQNIDGSIWLILMLPIRLIHVRPLVGDSSGTAEVNVFDAFSPEPQAEAR